MLHTTYLYSLYNFYLYSRVILCILMCSHLSNSYRQNHIFQLCCKVYFVNIDQRELTKWELTKWEDTDSGWWSTWMQIVGVVRVYYYYFSLLENFQRYWSPCSFLVDTVSLSQTFTRHARKTDLKSGFSKWIQNWVPMPHPHGQGSHIACMKHTLYIKLTLPHIASFSPALRMMLT